MTWEDLRDGWRVQLQEAGGHIRLLEKVLVEIAEADGHVKRETVIYLIIMLTAAMSGLHTACEFTVIGLDALHIILRKATTTEEVEND